MSELSDEELDKLLRQHYRQSAGKEQTDQVWHRLASELGPQQIIPRRGSLPTRLIFAAVQLLIVAFVAAVLLSNGFFSASRTSSLDSPTDTSTSNDEFSRLTLEHIRKSSDLGGGTTKIVLSKQLLGGQLQCIGIVGSWTSDAPYAVVIAETQMLDSEALPTRTAYDVYLYQVSNKWLLEQSSPPDWPRLRAMFGSSSWPEGNPLYVAPDGQPSMADVLASFGDSNLFAAGLVWAPDAKQTIAGWTVKVTSVYADDLRIFVAYAIWGQDRQYVMNAPLIQYAGTDTQVAGNSLMVRRTITGPVSDIVWFPPARAKSGEMLNLRFQIPAIHAGTLTQNSGCTNMETTFPKATQPGTTTAETSSLEVIGPFNFDLQVPMSIAPTPIVRPYPVPTGAAQPLEATPTSSE